MPAIVAPGIARYTIRQTQAEQEVVNILDVRVGEGGPLDDRDSALRIVARDILDNWNDHILALQVDNVTALSVDYLDLNSLTGPRGSITTTDNTTWPAEGANSSDAAMPGMVAMRIDKETTGGHGTKRGRLYLAGIAETGTAGDDVTNWSSLTVSTVQAAFAAFDGGAFDREGVGSPSSVPVVIHTVDGVYSSDSDITAWTANPNISTQVRRGALR